jgi:hypothetical protein
VVGSESRANKISLSSRLYSDIEKGFHSWQN